MSIGRLIVEFEARTGKFETDTARAGKIMERRAREIEKQAARIGTAFGASFVAGTTGLLAFIDSQAKSIANLQDLAEKAGDSAEAFGSLSKASAVSGISLDTVAAASVKLTAALSKMGEDGGPAADAIKALGLNFEEFVELSPVSQIEAIANSLAKFKDGASKTAVAVALFGRSGAEILPFLNDLADGSERQIALTEEQIKAANAYAEQVGALKGEISLLAKTTAASLIPQLSGLLSKVEQAVKYFARFAEESTFLSKALRGVEIVFETITVLAANVAYVFNATGREIGAIAAQMVALAKLDLTSFSAIGDAVKEDAARARAELDAFEKRMLSVKLPGSSSAGTDSRPTLNFRPGAEVADKTAASVKKAADAWKDYEFEVRKAIDAEDTERRKERLEAFNKIMEEGKSLTESLMSPNERYAADIENLNKLLAAGAITQETYNRAVFGLQDAFDKASKKSEETTDKMSVFAEQAARNMQDAFADFLFDPFDKGLKGMLASFADTLQRMAAEAAAAEIFKSLGFGQNGGGFDWGGLIGKGLSFLSGLGTGSAGNEATALAIEDIARASARAMGGPVSAGAPYLVGERGPELFVPSSSGKITPNNKMGGDTINNYINIPITAPSGSVGRPTMDQISSAALAGAQRAQSRKR